MKKIMFAFVLLLGLCVASESLAQNSGLYFSAGGAFLRSELSFDRDRDNDIYCVTQNGRLIALGLGYRSIGGFGLELNAMVESTELFGVKDHDGNDDYYNGMGAFGATAFHSSQITRDVAWMVMLSYRRVISDGKFHDILIEPFVFEYRRNGSHLGFRLSVVSIEGMTMIQKKKKSDDYWNTPTPTEDMSVAGFGLSMNSFPIRISYYF